MSSFKPVVVIGAFLAVVVASAAFGAVVGERSKHEPPMPPWVYSDGSENPAEVPERIEVSGPDGELCLDSNGKPVTVPNKPPLPPPPSEIKPDNAPRKIVTDRRGRTTEIVEDVDDFGCEELREQQEQRQRTGSLTRRIDSR